MYDVIISGAGPAGSVCAEKLSNSGLSTLLLEKGPKPYEKPCGGSVNFHTWDALGYTAEEAEKLAKNFGGREIRGVRLFSPSLKYHSTTIPINRKFSFSIEREKFDYFLFKKAKEAGATIKMERVESIHENGKSIGVVTNKSEYEARFLVGADGFNSVVARETGLRTSWPPNRVGACIRVMVSKPAQEIAPIKEFFLVESGYGWAFPKFDQINIGYGHLLSIRKSLKASWETFINRLRRYSLFNIGEVQEKLESWCAPLTGPDWPNIARRNILLVGDAGGFVFPSNGEGLYLAVKSGKFAAQAILESVKGRTEPAKIYKEYCIGKLKSQVDYSEILHKHLVLNPKNVEDLVKFSASVPQFRDLIVEEMFFSGDMSKIIKLPLKVKVALLAAKFLI